MTPAQARRERAELEQQQRNAVAAAAQARNGRAATTARRDELDRELDAWREDGAKRGDSPAWRKRFKAITEERAANSAMAAEHEARLEAADRAARDVQTRLGYLLVDELATFRADAEALSKTAQKQFQSVVPAISEAVSAFQTAALHWAHLAPAMRTVLRERDEAEGIYRDASYYTALARMPAFPIKVGDPNFNATPPGVALLAPKPKPKRRVTA